MQDRHEYMKLYQRAYRAKKKAAKAPQKPVIPVSGDPIADLVRWSEDVLRVPPGHPLAGQPMRLPDYGALFLSDVLTHRYSLLSVARKSSKSAILSIYLLARLCGPLRQDGWRGGIASTNREKSLELRMQMEAIAKASGLSEIKFWRAPFCESTTGRLDFLSADKNSGAASGFDDSCIDEGGLLKEKDRELVNGMRSAISARDGRFLMISIVGRGPYVREMIEQKDDPATSIHLYQADKDAKLDDEEQWHKASPALACGIKSISYMRDESRRVLLVSSDQNDFKAQELNIAVDPGKQMICSEQDFRACLVDAERDGHVVAGFDNGGSNSMTTCSFYWPFSGRLECYASFAGVPNLSERGTKDGVGDLYVRLHQAGELDVYDGFRSTPVSTFLVRCFERVKDQDILMCGADRYRKSDSQTALMHANLEHIPMQWRGQGAGGSATWQADGSHDVLAFQRAVLTDDLKVTVGRGLLTHAISESSVRYDVAGNPAIEKARDGGRIDVLQSAVIALGLGELVRAAGKPESCFLGSTVLA